MTVEEERWRPKSPKRAGKLGGECSEDPRKSRSRGSDLAPTEGESKAAGSREIFERVQKVSGHEVERSVLAREKKNHHRGKKVCGNREKKQ